MTLTHSVRVRILLPQPKHKTLPCEVFFLLNLEGFEASGSELCAGGT